MENKLKVLILAGGTSGERDISLASARAIHKALRELGHRTVAVDSADGTSLLDQRGDFILTENNQSLSKIELKPTDATALATALHASQYRDVDLVMIALHGGAGEDGTIQAILDLAGKKYTGSKIMASAIAMNKAFAKRIVKNEHIPTPEWMTARINKESDIENYLPQIIERFALPLIVKPNNSGSTIGLTLVKKEVQLAEALADAARVDREVLVEQYIQGREITASVIDGEGLPLVEIIPSEDLYDYKCKYTRGKSKYVCPADIPPDLADRIMAHAVSVYELIECSGLARVDFILDRRNCPFFLEVNTLPGMTELSLAPMAAAQIGLTFNELVQKICNSALI